MTADLPVLARITDDYWREYVEWNREMRDEAFAWMRANGVEPNDARLGFGTCLEVVLMDCPAIRYRVNVLDDVGKPVIDCAGGGRRHVVEHDGPCTLRTRVVISALRVPVPVPLPSWLEGP